MAKKKLDASHPKMGAMEVKKALDAPQPKNCDAPAIDFPSDPYIQRKHRVKYQVGYGVEGAARGKHPDLPGMSDSSPRAEDDKKEAKANAKQKKQYSKTRPNPF